MTEDDADLLAEKMRRAKKEVGKAEALTEKIQNKYQVKKKSNLLCAFY